MSAAHDTRPRAAERELDDITLARARAGDAQAFERLVELYQDRVFALLWRYLGRSAQAAVVDDLAQDTFLGVYRALPRYSSAGPARLSTWILTIAARSAHKHRRSHGRAAVLEPADPAGLPAADSPLQQAERQAFAVALAGAIDELTPRLRLVFLLSAYHGFDYQDIASALDIDLGTVKSRLARARHRLRDRLREFRP